MSSPPKRPRTTEYSDLDETPTRPRPQSVRHDSDGVVFDDPATQGVTAKRSTSSFTAVLFIPFEAIPKDGQPVEPGAAQEILPAALRGHSDFRDTRLRGFMWKTTQAGVEDEATLLENHAHLRDIVDDSIASSNLHRSEGAWNCLVHTPVLRRAISRFASLEVEPISSAQILPAFRPLSKGSDQTTSRPPNASVSGASGQGLGTPNTRLSATALSVHKMVDFAVVLRPKEELQNLINTFLDNQPYTTPTVNQTIYEHLRTRPAPIFIETKTSSGNMDTANVQLGIWVAAWHQLASVWNLMFVLDAGTEIRMLDGNFRIGDTDSILGIYQLQAAIFALADWTNDTFEPWFTDLLARATVSRLEQR
ncbi:unnamed protein product [Clonostachys rhizophaga]|uniref:PD-(D/E)XK nuclease-like domain-containing protein n=1 Tax=Clonostachys rhizophaga TaxID=160324 RepID=A0A9N9VBJ7_9HYPO|nr:unnamed protein product [Clonostachys rhizophaga]